MDGRVGEGLLEREREFALLAGSLAAARAGAGGLVLVEGRAGLGKTALLRALRAQAELAGVRVLWAAGGELEREFPFGLVRQLFEGVVRAAPDAERERLFAGAAALAGPVVGAAPSAGEASADASFATLHGLYWLVAAIAESGPLLLVLDDIHWADAQSLRFLDFLARRVAELPVLLAAGLRPHEAGAEWALLAGLGEAPGAQVVRPAALSAAAVRTLVDAELGPETTDDVVAGAHEATGGNPLLMLELLRTLGGSAASPAAVRAAVPSSVTRSVTRRLGRASDAARSAARALAVLGDRPDSALLAAAARLPPSAIEPALAELVAADLVERDAEGIRYVHPLLAQAVAADVARAERDGLLHRAAAALRARPGADEQAVVHLLAAAPLGEPWVVPLLRRSAARALAGGAPDAAVRRLQRALAELTDDSPDAAALHLELGRAAASAGDPVAPEHLAAAAAAHDPEIAALATEMQLNAGAFDPADGLAGIAARLRAAVERLGDEVDPGMRDRMLGQLLNVLFIDSRLAGDRARVLAEAQTDGGDVLAHRAWDAAAGDAPAAVGRDLARRALAGRPFSRLAALEQPTPIWAVLALTVLDGAGESDGAIADAEALLRRHPSSLGRSFASYMRAEWLLVFGSAALAEAAAAEALALFERAGNAQSVVSSRAALASALVLRGALGDAEAALAPVPADEAFDAGWGGGLVWTSRAELRLAQGRPKEAVADLRRLDALCARYGWRRFARGTQTALLARALVQSGEVEEGHALAEREASDARRRGASRLEAEALMALAAASPGEAGLQAARAAVEAAAAAPAKLVQARAAYALGAALRRAGRRTDARTHLIRARELAHRVDATALAADATEELTIAGGRPRRIATSGREALTPSERRVAEHAARGLSNREIAEALFVTRKTIEFQLGAAYGKLGIRSRAELAAALGLDAAAAA